MKKLFTLCVFFMLVVFANAQVTLWGAASAGGVVNGNDSIYISPINGNGTIFNIRSDGTNFNVAHDFNSGFVGTNFDNAFAPPFGNLVQATSTTGLLYGLGQGGNAGDGVIFSVDPATNVYKELYQFHDPHGDYNNGGGNGYDGPGSLVQASDGKLYGMTQDGGSHGNGTIYSFDPTTNAYTNLYDFWVYDSIYGFTGPFEGANPAGDLLQVGGLFYGMTLLDGANGGGTIFSFDPGSSTCTDLYDFSGAQWPTGNLVQSSYDGNLYGMTPNGGMYGNGVLFSYDIRTATYTDVVDFTGSNGANGGGAPGANPFGSLVEVWNVALEPNNPLLYGTTSSGDYDNGNNGGVLFYYDPGQGSYNFLLDVYDGTSAYDAASATNPYCNLMQANDGNLYGMIDNGGNNGLGILFGCDTFGNVINGDPSYDLIDFDGSLIGMGGYPGMYPSQSLMQATNGSLYGMTYWGNMAYEDGNLFSFDIGSLAETDIVDFNTGPFPYYAGGFIPNGLVQAGNGLLYGTTQGGGIYGSVYGGNNYNGGVIYSIDPSTNAFTTVTNFGGYNGGDDNTPVYQLTLGADGKLYGTTDDGWGTMFSLDTLGNYTVLVDFAEINGYGYGGLTDWVQANNGLMYGAQGGDLISFDQATVSDANPPTILNSSPTGSGLIQASNSVLYGVSAGGGAYSIFPSPSSPGVGTLYSIDTSSGGNYHLLWSFNDTLGGNPSGYLVQARNGLLYGMTNNGPGVYYNSTCMCAVNNSCNCGGVIFSFDTNSADPTPYKELFDFSSTTGYNPDIQITASPQTINGSFYLASDGNLYGTTTDGGPDGGDGVIFKYIPGSSFGNGYTVLHNLSGADGIQPPQSSLIELRSLATSAVPGPLCIGATVDVPFTATGLFTYANVFTAQLSDASGNFGSPVPIGTLAGTISGTISATIPGGTTSGTGYRIRVVAGNPNFTGSDNGSNITINAAVTPAVSIGITSGSQTECAGSSVTFTATPTNGGSSPTYNFEVNSGSVQNSTSATYTTTSLNNGDQVTCIMTSDAACASPTTGTSNSITMTVNANVTPSVSIGITSGSQTECAGSSVTFTATPTNGGASPAYNFEVNSGSVQNSTSATYTTTSLNDGDQVTCVITSDAACASPTTGTSNSITMTVSSTVTPSVNIGITSGSQTECTGSSVTFTATPTNGGSSPTYNFEVNSGSVQNSTSATYTTTSLNNSDQVTCVMTSDAACASPTTGTSNSITMTVNACGGTNTWLGNTNDWNLNTNWSSGSVPSCTDVEDHIPATSNDPVISVAENAGNLVIDDGVTLTVNAALSVCGNLTGGSSTTANVQGTTAITLTGTAVQDISGIISSQNPLALDNTGTAPQAQLMSGAVVNIYNSLVLQNNNTLDVSSGTLTLKSASVTQAGIIDNFSGSNSGSITGNIVAERYYAAPTTGNSYNQHEMGSPVNTPGLSQFGASGTAGYVTDADCDGTKLDISSPYGTVFGYDETHGAACGIEQWKVLTGGNAVNGVGYSIRNGGPGTLSLTGAPNISGNVTVNGTNSGWTNNTLQGYPEQSGWTLASNPYPAALQISGGSLINNVDAGWDGTGVMVWNTTGGSAGSYVLTTTLAPFQAFMVHKTNAGGSATYTIYATDRSTSTTTFYKEATANTLNITATNQSSGLIDDTNVGFNQNVTGGFDPNFDVHKIAGDPDRHSLYTISNGNWMCHNINPSIEQTPTVPMGFSPGVSGTYTLTFDGVTSFDATSYITLEDTKLNVLHDVRSGDYTFTANANDGWNRFVLHFTPPASINTTDATCSQPGMINVIQPGTANWAYTIADGNNATLSSGTLNVNSPVSASVPTGVYTLTLKDNNGYSVVKNIQVTGADAVSASINASATAIQQSETVTFTATADNATNYSWNFGDGTTGAGTTVTHTYQHQGDYNVTLMASDATGCSGTSTKSITVTSRSVTGIINIGDNNITIWSNDNKVYVDFTNAGPVDATVTLYNIIGQQISQEKFTANAVYTKEIDNIEAGYIVVNAKNGDDVVTRKVFIAGSK